MIAAALVVALFAAKPGPETYLAEGLAFVKAKDAGAVERSAREGLKKFPGAPGFHLLLGEAHRLRNEDAEAFYEYQWEVLRTGPERPAGELAMSRAKSLMAERGPNADEVRLIVSGLEKMLTAPKEALRTFESVESDRGSRFLLRELIAEAKAASGDLAGAAAIYRSLITQDPYFVPAYVQLADVLVKQGKKKDAEKLLAKARSIDSEHWRLLAYERATAGRPRD